MDTRLCFYQPKGIHGQATLYISISDLFLLTSQDICTLKSTFQYMADACMIVMKIVMVQSSDFYNRLYFNGNSKDFQNVNGWIELALLACFCTNAAVCGLCGSVARQDGFRHCLQCGTMSLPFSKASRYESTELSLTSQLRQVMSYALESKKRKFDRILESLTDGTSQPRPAPESNVSLAPKNNGSTSSRIASFDSSKKRRVSPSLNKNASQSSLVGHYLPSSRAAFLERLGTYRSITKWRIPSTSPANAAEWAKRGWICAGIDTVSCGTCLERVTIDLSTNKTSQSNTESAEGDEENQNRAAVQDEEEKEDMVIQFQEALAERYRQMITSSHAANCSWRKRGCDCSIQRIEGLLTSSTAISAMRTRYDSIVDKIKDCPPVSDLPLYDTPSLPRMEDYKVLDLPSFHTPALKLATCGWQYKDEDVVDCKHCFRSLGLWLYRGENPTVEHLDAVESHLEYCPWRDAEAQDTEFTTHMETGEGGVKKLKLPGWALVYHAVRKQSLRKQGRHSSDQFRRSHEGDTESVREHLSPEQRDKKMRDLMRRIKEIKKPFNVKSLLRKKDKTVDGR